MVLWHACKYPAEMQIIELRAISQVLRQTANPKTHKIFASLVLCCRLRWQHSVYCREIGSYQEMLHGRRGGWDAPRRAPWTSRAGPTWWRSRPALTGTGTAPLCSQYSPHGPRLHKYVETRDSEPTQAFWGGRYVLYDEEPPYADLIPTGCL